MYLLGINAYHGDASAALFCDGQLIAAAEEERFTRVKHAAGFPAHAVRYCLNEAGITIQEVDHLAVGRDPWVRLGAKAWTAIRLPRFAFGRLHVAARASGLGGAVAQALGVAPGAVRARVHRVDHHLAHLASAFFVSPFAEAAVLSVDGLGDFASAMWGVGEGNRLRILGTVTFPHSLGLYYTALTQYLGFWAYGDEYKVMGLAAYGQPDYLDEFRRIVSPHDGEGFRLGLDYFLHHRQGTEMTWESSAEPPKLGRLFSPYLERRLGPARTPEDSVHPRHHAIAATLQRRLEETLFHLLRCLAVQTGRRRLCLAGGVAFNCVANGKIFEETPFEEVYVQPAAGDAGLAIGSASFVYHHVLGHPRSFVMTHAAWGPAYSTETIQRALEDARLSYRRLSEDALCRDVASRLAQGEIVGWFQGRMEWGPRALGHRSMLADPRREDMRHELNERIKHREWFRPFAPAILEEEVSAYFAQAHPSPFMTFAYPVRPEQRSAIPAVTHVDGTGRLQTVHRSAEPLFWQLIHEFRQLTGVPVLLNTSFNENEPIVCTPREAIECFARTRMDALAIGPYLVERRPQGAQRWG